MIGKNDNPGTHVECQHCGNWLDSESDDAFEDASGEVYHRDCYNELNKHWRYDKADEDR